MMELMSSSVTHELITPLRCIIQITESHMKKLTDPNQIKQARLILDTTSLVCA
jgi:hypothetical protein